MQKIGVIGAGVMGCGVAQCFASHGHSVILIDVTEEKLQVAKQEISNNTRMQRFFDKNAHTPEDVVKNVVFTLDYSLLANADFIIENVPETRDAKQQAYCSAGMHASKECIYLANTSCISITEMASFIQEPSQMVGVHFMNPVYAKPAVEVITGFHSSEMTLAVVQELLQSVKKEAIVVNDYPGFVSNRISHLFMNEAAFVVQDQVAAPEAVDAIFKKCYGHKMGPLETADLIGLDTVVNSLDILYTSYQDSKFRCCPLLKKMVAAGLCGKKTGQGFYVYNK